MLVGLPFVFGIFSSRNAKLLVGGNMFAFDKSFHKGSIFGVGKSHLEEVNLKLKDLQNDPICKLSYSKV